MRYSNTIRTPLFSRWHPILGWTVLSLLGAFALAILALSRGESLNALWLAIASVTIFAISYRFHSAWLMTKVGITGCSARALRTGVFATSLLALACIVDSLMTLYAYIKKTL